MFSWLHDDFDAARDLCDALQRGRARPPTFEQPPDVATAWGELRSLMHEPLTGGERWEEWRALFEAFPEGARHDAVEYVADLWGVPDADLDALRHEFNMRFLARNIAALREAGVAIAPPPATEQQVAAWEGEHGLLFPTHLRRFFLEVSSGHDEPDETFVFNLLDPYFTPYASMFDEWAESEEMVAAYDRVLALMLHHLASTGEDGEFELPAAIEGLEKRDDEALGSLIPLLVFLEGNHGDWADFVITKGPLADHMITWDTMIHCGFDTGTIVYRREHVSDFLVRTYKLEFLGEDMWWERDEL